MAAAVTAPRPLIIDEGAQPSLALIHLFEQHPGLWARVRTAVELALPDRPSYAFRRMKFNTHAILGAGYWGFVYPTGADRWVVKVTCDEQAGQIAQTLLSRPKLRAHPGICFMLAAWELPGVFIGTGRGHMPVTIIVRENLPSEPRMIPDVLNEDFVISSQTARRFNEAELLRREAVEYSLWDSARAYAEARRDDYRDYQRLLKLFARHEAFKAPVDFLRKYLRATGEMLVDVTAPNMGWRAFDTRDVGGHAPGDPMHAVIRDAEHTDGRESPRPEPLPNPGSKRGDELWAETKRKRAEHELRQAQVASLLVEARIIALGEGADEKFFMLHPSTVIPDGWQVSYFDRRGPYGHEEGKTLEKALERALEMRDLSAVRPVSEQEFIAISTSPEFLEGVKRVTYTGLLNTLGYEFGYELPRAYIDDAREAENIEDAIQILRIGLETLRRQAKRR